MDSRICGEDVETFFKDMFEFGETRIVYGDKAVEVGIMGELEGNGAEGLGKICLMTREKG